MKVWGLTKGQLYESLDIVNGEYSGNAAFNNSLELRGRAYKVTLRVKDSRARGHSLGTSGRHLVSACWHLHRDWMIAVFSINPDARIQTSMADYKGVGDFFDKFEETGTVNVGSRVNPMQLRDKCNCLYDDIYEYGHRTLAHLIYW